MTNLQDADVEGSRRLLDAVGLEPHPEELLAIAIALPVARAAVEILYATEDVRYEAPAVTFEPRPSRS